MIIKKTLFSLIILLLGLNTTQGQEHNISDYPDGIYQTKEEFINKTPSEVRELTVKKIELVNDSDSVVRRCYFMDKATTKKIKKAFAVSYHGSLYFSNWAILKNKNKEDKSLSPASSMNAFVLVTMHGEKYLYTEAGLINHWQSGLSAGVAGGIGGLAGGALGEAIDGSFPETTEFGTGVVWDVDNQEFNVFRNCPDFNDFIKDYGIEKVECGKEPFDLERVRETIKSINEKTILKTKDTN
ncbi:hypothetical protein [Maribellus maritimus]|uniref:hypothetical protein n=1 Tax=Maribellus maritimus TaxID=2870838 RepID=UPI001EEBF73C|nr:hypothetical protein [Maribellus maritimus]MCG6190477.1 hypothetical protein [Maribellus maritimus]